MSLRDALEAKGDELIASKGDGWLEDIIGKGQEELDGQRAALLENTPEGEKPDEDALAILDAGGEALDLLNEHRAPFVRLGQVGFGWLLAHWEDQDEAAARRHYLAHEATFAERRKAMHAAGDKLAAAEDAKQAAWAEVRDVLKAIGTIGLKLLVKLAMGALAL